MQKVSEKQKLKNKEKAEKSRKLHEWFLSIWDEREEIENGRRFVRCFETGVKLYRETYRQNSCVYSHILPKSRYEEFAMLGSNLVIVHPDAHAQYETFPEKAPKQFALKQELLNKLRNE